MRAALHAHILCWFKRREIKKDYKPVPPVKRTAPGTEPRQRPLDQKVEPLRQKQEDSVYQHAHVGLITGEMVRPDVSGEHWGNYDAEKLRIAGLARAIQTRLPYLHSCTPLYCLKNRSACRFFFPNTRPTYNCVASSNMTFKRIRCVGRKCYAIIWPGGRTSRTSVTARIQSGWPNPKQFIAPFACLIRLSAKIGAIHSFGAPRWRCNGDSRKTISSSFRTTCT